MNQELWNQLSERVEYEIQWERFESIIADITVRLRIARDHPFYENRFQEHGPNIVGRKNKGITEKVEV